MNLFETLRKFKTIKPDPWYAEKSKRAILASEQNAPAMNPFRRVLQFVETGAAVALAGFFVLLITGAFSNSTYIAPVQFSVIDAAGLHAEAQAIDMQIQLASVNYPDVASTNNGSTPEATAPAATAKSFSAALKTATSSASTQATAVAGTSTGEAATTSTTSVDDALRALSE